jgi:hypothetical protein
VQLIAGILGESRRQGIEPDRAGAGLLNAIVLHARTAGHFHIHRAIDEVGIAANTDMPFDQSNPCARSNLEAHTGIRSAGPGFRGRDEHELDAGFAVSAASNLD